MPDGCTVVADQFRRVEVLSGACFSRFYAYVHGDGLQSFHYDTFKWEHVPKLKGISQCVLQLSHGGKCVDARFTRSFETEGWRSRFFGSLIDG